MRQLVAGRDAANTRAAAGAADRAPPAWRPTAGGPSGPGAAAAPRGARPRGALPGRRRRPRHLVHHRPRQLRRADRPGRLRARARCCGPSSGWRGRPTSSARCAGTARSLDDRAAFLVPPNAAFLPQVPQLVSDSVRDNVGLGPVPADDLARALTLAAVDDDVAALPDGRRHADRPARPAPVGRPAPAAGDGPGPRPRPRARRARRPVERRRRRDRAAAVGQPRRGRPHRPRRVPPRRRLRARRPGPPPRPRRAWSGSERGPPAQRTSRISVDGRAAGSLASPAPWRTVDAFPELARERERLAFSRASRDRMIERLERVDPQSAADEFTAEYVEVTVEEALEDLRSPGAGDFFGRIDTSDGGRRRALVHRPPAHRGRRSTTPSSSTGGRRSPRRSTAPPPPTRSASTCAGASRFDEGELTAYLDEHLDDPDAADVAGGIPDPVLAEIGAERTGAMREIVATIQAEQDLVIRAPIDQVLVVQGGPGTGKTAVALHRAAYLLFEHRRRLARDGVLVIGPNRAFLDYVGNVLPSLGERSVRQCTVLDLCVPKVEITGVDDPATARAKGDVGDARRAAARRHARRDAARPTTSSCRSAPGASCSPATRSASGSTGPPTASIPFNQRRQRLRADRPAGAAPAHRPATTRGREAGPLRKALDAAWPTQQPIKLVDRLLPGPRGRRRAWTAADQLLVDEANSILNGPPLVYGHVVVDEAQDHSAVALRVIGRRSPAASMTLVGDVAQSTTPAGQERWADVFAYLVGRRRRPLGDGRRADDRLPRARADPDRRQPAAPADRRRRQRQPQRARRGPRPGVDRTRRRPSCRPRGRGGRSPEAPPPADRRRRPARPPRRRSPPRSTTPGCTPSTTSTSCTPARSRCSGRSRSRASSSTASSSSSPTRSSTARPAAPACCTSR